VRALLVSDIHYSLKQFDWIVDAASDFDVVVLAGDHLDIASRVAPDAQIAVVLEYMKRIAARTTVVACSGNHDLDGRNDFGERAAAWLDEARDAGVIVDGASLADEKMLLTVCPWWDGPQTRTRVDVQLAADAEHARDRMWVWVYHAPPEPSPTSWTGRRHYGDADLTAWIEHHRPAVVLCGHVHQAPFASSGTWIDRIGTTTVLNAGRQRGPIPTRIEIDTGTREASWFSLVGAETELFA